MDKLREYIKNNQRTLDDMEPADGHFERFEARLNAQNRQPKRPVRIMVAATLGIAAALVIALMLIPLDRSINSSCTLSSELAEVSSYYNLMLEQEIDKMQQLVANVEDEAKTELLADIMVMREESKEFLQWLCTSHVDEADAVPLIVKHYQSHISALQATVNIIENSRVDV